MSLQYNKDLLKEIGIVVTKASDFNYDSIGINEDETILGIGFVHNLRNSITLVATEKGINVSFYHKNVGPYEALKFFIEILEKCNTSIVIMPDFS